MSSINMPSTTTTSSSSCKIHLTFSIRFSKRRRANKSSSLSLFTKYSHYNASWYEQYSGCCWNYFYCFSSCPDFAIFPKASAVTCKHHTVACQQKCDYNFFPEPPVNSTEDFQFVCLCFALYKLQRTLLLMLLFISLVRIPLRVA